MASAAVVIIPGGGDPKPYTGPAGVRSEDAYFRESAPNEFRNNSAKLIMTSLSVTNMSSSLGLRPSGDSFIRGAIQAWGEHLHLVIRPDEMLSHAEEIRSLFVDHQGQEEILVKDLTWYDVLLRFKDEIQERVKTPWLLDWITPNFSTTTDSDIMTANIIMMGLTKKPDSPATELFWNQIVSGQVGHVCGDPPMYVSGWITGFVYWNDDGAPFARTSYRRYESVLSLDGVEYPVLDLTLAPVEYVRAPFVMLDWEGMDRFPAYVAAGTLGKQITEGPPEGYREALGGAGDGVALAEGGKEMHATLRPLSGWMLYEPLHHNTTLTKWGAEDELLDIVFNARRFMTGETCGVMAAS
ncbi:hypothetical protein N657DRAFT_661127 [Parathielavia appendiculata]|uniref:Uncharacterized protein n=1 Tax=Parathielavia appendiculata TaxID=2587402 RepID=A0AAN6Z6D8_9PEZI|nr:hypothetical protein N657DRAFT_661127 [Parathielavia appendiculata]